MAKFDPHNHEMYYKRWKENGSALEGLSGVNRAFVLDFLADMEIGANVTPLAKKGARSYGRLRNIKAKLQTLFVLLQVEFSIDSVIELESRDMDLLRFFKKMREGQFMCRKADSKPLTAVGTYARIFKAFWHWYQRVNRKKGKDIRDITVDLDSRDEKPSFVYFTVEDLRKMCDIATYDYKVLMMFMFDSGIRSPTELMNVRVSDLEWNNKQEYYTLSIREETSKTFGRKIKLLLCSSILRDYLKTENLAPDTYIFKKTPQRVNEYLRRIGYKALNLGEGTVKLSGGKKYYLVKSGVSMYDFRHSSACYWLPRYKSESALKYRFGWKKSDMIHYYTELLGMRDTIQEDDLYVDISKTELEKQIQDKGKTIEIMEERLQEQDRKMAEIMDILRALQLEKVVRDKIVLQNPSGLY
jgi:integrase